MPGRETILGFRIVFRGLQVLVRASSGFLHGFVMMNVFFSCLSLKCICKNACCGPCVLASRRS